MPPAGGGSVPPRVPHWPRKEPTSVLPCSRSGQRYSMRVASVSGELEGGMEGGVSKWRFDSGKDVESVGEVGDEVG